MNWIFANLSIYIHVHVYTAISKKVAPEIVMHDARSMFHSSRCTMVDCYCEWEFQVGNK